MRLTKQAGAVCSQALGSNSQMGATFQGKAITLLHLLILAFVCSMCQTWEEPPKSAPTYPDQSQDRYTHRRHVACSWAAAGEDCPEETRVQHLQGRH